MPAPHVPGRVLVTGGAGFIGSNFVRHLLASDGSVRVVTLDAMTYAGRRENLGAAAGDARHTLLEGDICDAALVRALFAEHRIDTVVHFAAESHVDRSITGPAAFVTTNLVGTFTLLEAARDAWRAGAQGAPRSVRFHHVSTDEVFGSLGEADPAFTEETPYAPNSPYSASKAGSDHLVRAYHHTYGLPVTTTNCSNNYGPCQHAEKFIPTVIRSCLAGVPVPVYGTGMNVRDWLYVDDHCRAVDLVMRCGAPGALYLVGGRNEHRNLDIARLLCRVLAEATGVPPERYLELIRLVTDRPGHDFRYAIDAGRLTRELGWQPLESFESGLRKTVAWYLQNPWCLTVAV
ncbi:MAG TPA: dTDP-glucose 4,6-dehydratase [Gemmatimonadales bacterium]|nr:dTDP-glucose 4,6-dehydratase [Gemmatimonadales bacterium]